MEDQDAPRVLVPVIDVESVPHLLLVALGMAGPRGAVTAISVVVDEDDEPALERARAALRRVAELADGTGVTVDTVLVAAQDVPSAVHAAAEARSAELVVMGWAGSGSSASAFGAIVDRVVGRSRVPLLMVRRGSALPSSVLVAFDTDQLHPSGRRGLVLAARVARALRSRHEWPVTVLQTGDPDSPDLPVEVTSLADRSHHDPRRRHHALEAAAAPSTLVLAPVAPSIAGLRSATSRINWAAGDATLVVAVDVGPVDDGADLAHLPTGRLRAVPSDQHARPRRHGVAITAWAAEPIDRRAVVAALRELGEVSSIRTWWEGDGRPHLSLAVAVVAGTDSEAVGAVMEVVDGLVAMRGAHVRYDLVAVPTPLRVQELHPMGLDHLDP